MPRNQEIVALYREGRTCEAIGEQFGITRSRVSAIIKHEERKAREQTTAGAALDVLLTHDDPDRPYPIG